MRPFLFALCSIAALAAFQPPALVSQPAAIKFKTLDVEDGLSNRSVTCIMQDRKGFVWIGRGSGSNVSEAEGYLNVYDGYKLTVFQHDPTDSTKISAGPVGALYEDREGNIWIGTIGGGLNRYDRTTGRFKHYVNDPDNPKSISDDRVRSIYQDSQGSLWIGTYNGLNRFDPKIGGFIRYQNDPANPHSISNNSVSSIVEDGDGTLWVGTRSGLNAYTRKSGRFIRFMHNPADPATLGNDYINALFLDSRGTLWVGTDNFGLNAFDRYRSTCTRIILKEARIQSMYGERTVNSITEDAGGVIWIGIAGGGLQAFNRRIGSLTLYQNDPIIPQSLSDNDVTCIMSDAEQLMWVGTAQGGMNLFRNKKRLFDVFRNDPANPLSISDNRVTGFCEDDDGKIWIGTFGGGVNVFNPQTETCYRLRLDRSVTGSFEANDISALCFDHNGNIWIGTFDQGLIRYNKVSNAFTVFRENPDDETTINRNAISVIYEDRSGTVWIGTAGGGLNAFDPRSGKFKRYVNDFENEKTISGNVITAIHESYDHTLWIGTQGSGLNAMDKQRKSVVRYIHDPAKSGSIGSNGIYSIVEDDRGRLWVGTDDGISVLPADAPTFLRFAKNDGLANNLVYGVLPDGKGNLWISTAEGVTRFTPPDHISTQSKEKSIASFRNFDVTDGLQSDRFNQGAYFRTSRGYMLFGGINGFNMFLPDSIKEQRYVPTVTFTDFLLFNKSVKAGGKDGFLKSTIGETREIVLPYNQNVFTFEFAVLSYINPEKNNYAYFMEGFDKQWNYTNASRRFATYTNLEPGTYVLHIRGSGSEGIWNNKGVSIRIVITPPWWKTIWAYIAYLVVGVGGVFGAWRFQQAKVIRKEREQAKIREAQLRAEAAELQAAAAELQAKTVEAQANASEARAKAVEAQANASEARAMALQAENERKELELEKARELEKAYSALDDSMRNLKATQDQLIHAEKMASLGELTAGIAHEIKNPLNFVNNFAALSVRLVHDLRDELETNKDKPVAALGEETEFILSNLEMNSQKITEHGKRADSIVHSMLLHSRGITGEFQSTLMNDFVEDYVNLTFHGMRAQNQTFNVTLMRDYDPNAGSLDIIPQEMSRVLINIINNAFYIVDKRSKNQENGYVPTVWISTERRQKQFFIKIRDNGMGMNDEVKSKIFQPFFTTKPAGQGTGLGLSMSLDIVNKGHKGSLTVESTLGEGTTFIIALPIK